MSRSRRERAAGLLTKPGVRILARRLPRWRGVVVLNYHRVGDWAQPWDRTLWNADAETLDGQLATLAREAEVVGPQDILRLARENRRGRAVLVTFDDGYRDNYEIAYPLLRRHGLTATFFPTTGFLDHPRAAWWDEIAWIVNHARSETIRPGAWSSEMLPLGPEQDATIATLVAHYKALPGAEAERFLEEIAEATGAGRCGPADAAKLWMTWEMLREMQAGGMTIGGHTATHPILARLSVAQQEQEIADCAQRLEQELGQPMRWFAYPVGARDSFTADTQRLLRERGVQLAFSFHGGFAGFAHWNPLDVPRTHVGADYGPEVLQATLWLPQFFTRS